MTKNVGNLERIIRIIVGIALIAIVFVGPKSIWGWIGVVPLLTGLIGWCPPYQLLGINTCSMKK
jgi:membrane protein implicated in regulation of membrane protease activity